MNQAQKDLKSASQAKVKKPTLKAHEIPIEKKLRILKALRVNTKFGEKVMLELEDSVLFLLRSFNTIKDTTIEEINSSTFYIENIKPGEKYTPALFEFHTVKFL